MSTSQELKIELLKGIVENPGWEPTQPVSSSVETTLAELNTDGWIVPRLDGWEATPKAIETYPNYYLDFGGQLRGETPAARALPPLEVFGGDDDGWERVTLPLISLGPRQRIESEVTIGAVKGSLIVLNSGQEERHEIEVTIRTRPA